MVVNFLLYLNPFEVNRKECREKFSYVVRSHPKRASLYFYF